MTVSEPNLPTNAFNNTVKSVEPKGFEYKIEVQSLMNILRNGNSLAPVGPNKKWQSLNKKKFQVAAFEVWNIVMA